MIFNFLQRKREEEKVSTPNVFVVTSFGVGHQYATNTRYNTTKLDPNAPKMLDSIKSFNFGGLSSAIHGDDGKYLGYFGHGIYFQTRLGIFALPFVNLTSRTLSDQATRMQALRVRLNNLVGGYLSRLETGLYFEANTNKNLSVSLELGVSNPIRYIESISIGFRRSIYNSLVLSDLDKGKIVHASISLDGAAVQGILDRQSPKITRLINKETDKTKTRNLTASDISLSNDCATFYVNRELGISNESADEKKLLEILSLGEDKIADDLRGLVIENVRKTIQEEAREKDLTSAGLIIARSRAGTLVQRVRYKLHRFVYLSVRLVSYKLGRLVIQPVIRIGSSIELDLNLRVFQRVIG